MGFARAHVVLCARVVRTRALHMCMSIRWAVRGAYAGALERRGSAGHALSGELCEEERHLFVGVERDVAGTFTLEVREKVTEQRSEDRSRRFGPPHSSRRGAFCLAGYALWTRRYPAPRATRAALIRHTVGIYGALSAMIVTVAPNKKHVATSHIDFFDHHAPAVRRSPDHTLRT